MKPVIFSTPMVQALLNTKPDTWPAEPTDSSKPLFPGEAKDDFLAKRDLIAFGIKTLLKTSKIPCEKKGLFVDKEQTQ